MIDKFRNNLLQILKVFHRSDTVLGGCSEKELLVYPGKLPDILKAFYMTAGKEEQLLHSRSFDFYPPEQFTERMYNNTNPGIAFARINAEQYVYVSGLTDHYTKEPYDALKSWSETQNSWGAGSRRQKKPPYSEFLYWLLCNAQNRMQHMITVTDRKAIRNYREICETELGALRFSIYIPLKDIDNGETDEDILFSPDQHLLIRVCEWEKNKFIIASDDPDVIARITQKYKCRLIRKDGKKLADPKYLCSDQPQMSFDEKLSAIAAVCFGKKLKPMPDEEICAFESDAGNRFPSAIRSFYTLFGNHKKMLDSVYHIPKLQALSPVDGRILFAEEEQDACSYLIDPQQETAFVQYGDRIESLSARIEDLTLYLAASQCAGFMKQQGLISKTLEISNYFIRFTSEPGAVWLNPKLKMIGIDYNDNTVLIMSDASGAFSTFEEAFDLPVEYL